MDTTVATNTHPLEIKGGYVALLTAQGFRTSLTIASQSRREVFDLSVSRPEVLFTVVVEIDERVTLKDYA